MNAHPSIDLIIGPMYSSKTTELLRRLGIFSHMKLSVLYINHIGDTRSSEEFSTHNVLLSRNLAGIETIKCSRLECIPVSDIEKYNIIGIDEAQFFPDLVEFSKKMVDIYQKKIIVAGLSSDYLQQPFGEIHKLLSICDDITKLYSYCSMCLSKNNIIRPAIFTKRITDTVEQVLIGADDEYLAVCRDCYLNQ
jgi:thymidine kinase